MKWYRIAGICIFFLTLVGLVISIWPVPKHKNEIPFSIPSEIAGNLELLGPYFVHVGEQTEITLRIILDEAPIEFQEVSFTSKLEMNLIEVNPRGEGKVTIDRDKPIVLKWTVTPLTSGVYSGILWLFYESTDAEKVLVLARPIELEAKTLFGFSFPLARVICLIGLVIASFIILFRKKKIC